jgi:hypothetical protein
MKNIIKQVMGTGALCVFMALCSVTEANYSPYAYTSSGYGTSYNAGTYGYGQGYTGNSYQTSYYSQGYNGYQQGYQGSYGSGSYNQGMGNAFAYVDNAWIEDQLRFAASDVNQKRPYQAVQRLQTVSAYVQQFGDSEIYRRLQLAMSIQYKSSLTNEVNSILADWQAGKMRLGWESGANQSYQGQDDISKSYIIGQLQTALSDLNNNQQNRGRQRLWGLVSAIPPLGNERLIRRVQYAGTVSSPSQMRAEIESIMSEINSGTLILNDTENNPYNYYYGYNTSPYTQPDQGGVGYSGYPGGGGQTGIYDTGYYSGTGTTVPTGSSYTPAPVYDGLNYGSTVQYQTPTTGTTAAPATGATAPATTAPVVPQGPDLTQLKANVSAAYENLKHALSQGDRAKIEEAQKAYADAQAAYEAAK